MAPTSQQLYEQEMSRLQGSAANGTTALVQSFFSDPNSPYHSTAAIAPRTSASSNSPGIGTRLLDLISRPLYAVGGLAEGVAANTMEMIQAQGGDPQKIKEFADKVGIDYNPDRTTLEDIGNFGKQFWEGLSGQDKRTPGVIALESLKEAGLPSKVAGAVGFATDLALDPFNAVPIAPLVRGAKGLISSARGGKGATTLAADAARDATIPVAQSRNIPMTQVPPPPKVPKNKAGQPVVTVTPPAPVPTPAATQAAKQSIAQGLVANATTTPVARAAGAKIAGNQAANAAAAVMGLPSAGALTPERVIEALDLTDRSLLEPIGIKAIAESIPRDALTAGIDTAIRTRTMKGSFGSPLSGNASITTIENAMNAVAPAASMAEAQAMRRVASALHGSRTELHDLKVAADAQGAVLGPVPHPAEVPVVKPTVVAEDINVLADKILDTKNYIQTGQHFDTAAQAKRFNDLVSAADKNVGTATAGLKIVEDAAEAQGVRHIVQAGAKGIPHNLRLSDIAQTVPTVTEHLTTVGAEKLAAGAARAIDTLGDVTQGAIVGGRQIGGRALGKAASIAAIKEALGSPAKVGTRIATDLYNARQALSEAEIHNITRWQAKHAGDSAVINSTVRSEITKLDDLTLSPSEQADIINKMPQVIEDTAAQIGAGPATVAAAASHAAADVHGTVGTATTQAARDAAQAAAQTAAQASTQKVSKAAAKANAKAAKTIQTQINQMMPGAPAAAKYDLALSAGVQKSMRLYTPRTPTLKAILESHRALGTYGAVSTAIREFRSNLDIAGKISGADQKTIFEQIRQRVPKSAIPTAQHEAYDAMKTAYHAILDTNNSVMSNIAKHGATVDQINEAIQMAFAGSKVNKVVPQFSKSKRKTWAQVMNEAHTWQVDDPMDFLDRMHKAVRELAGHQQVAMSFQNEFGKVALSAGDNAAEWFKLSDVRGLPFKERGAISPHLDPEVLYPKYALDALKRMEALVAKPKSFAGSTHFGAQFMNRVYDPILTVWKTYMTLPRPGYYTRNVLGDGIFNYFAGMNNFPKYYSEAAKLLTKKGSSSVTRTIAIGANAPVTVSGAELLRQFRAHGLSPSFAAKEDLIKLQDTNRLVTGLLENRGIQALSGASEWINDAGRLAQFVWEVERKGNIRAAKSIEHLYAIAARNVRKWHPDSGGLYGNEAKYMRRIIPFYSWLRQALPLVAESSMYRAGRVLAVPLANYNMAVANGANPASLSEQFSTSQIYPSFVTDNILGPISPSGMAVNLGTPTEATYGNFLNSPLSNVFGQVSPLVKTPIELMYGTKLGGGHISDKSDWVDSSIPVVSTVSGISGYSVTGSLHNLVTNAPGPVLDPQRVVKRGEKEHWANTNLANWLTGLGLTDYTKPSYMRIGINEQRAGISAQ